jgi:hypothetical protein
MSRLLRRRIERRIHQRHDSRRNADGNYYILAQADALGTNPETNETNNVTAVLVRIGPDLTISSLSGQTAAARAAPFTILGNDEERRRRIGGGIDDEVLPLHEFHGRCIDPCWEHAASRLSHGRYERPVVNTDDPVRLATGSYYLVAQADSDKRRPRTNETNNVGLLTIRIGPDLIVSSLTVPQYASAGAAFSVTDGTRNQGAGDAPASTTRFYLSINSSFDASDTLLGSRSVGALAANTTLSGSATLVMPAGTPAGTKYIIAVPTGMAPFPRRSKRTTARWWVSP